MPAHPNRWRALADRLPGIALVGAMAAIAMALARFSWFESTGISALTLAIVIGMLVGNTVYRLASIGACGVAFSKQTLLRLGIILYGVRLTFQDIAHVGIAGVTIDSLVLSSTFVLSWWMGTRLFGLDRRTAMLIGAGSSICGAAAVMATEPVVRGRADQVTVAVSTVVVFGTLAIFVYPALYHLINRYHPLAMSPTSFGIFAGSTIHEVAQVVAAGRSISEDAANTAIITKMVRVMMLAPFLAILSSCLSRTCETDNARPRSGERRASRIVLPWFALGFVAVAAINSLGLIPKTAMGPAITFDTIILAMAMAALGVTTHVTAIRTAGIRPLALAALLFAWLIFGGGIINAGVSAVLSGAQVDVWHASPVGPYENQESRARGHELARGLHDRCAGALPFRSVRPAGYPVSTHGPIGDVLRAQCRETYRPAHVFIVITKPGYKTLVTQVFADDAEYLTTDVTFSAIRAIVGHYKLHERGTPPAPDVDGPFYTLPFEFALDAGETRIPTPPIS
jgi:uncharacterized integral membrane protein (TIGR00698 family)